MIVKTIYGLPKYSRESMFTYSIMPSTLQWKTRLKSVVWSSLISPKGFMRDWAETGLIRAKTHVIWYESNTHTHFCSNPRFTGTCRTSDSPLNLSHLGLNVTFYSISKTFHDFTYYNKCLFTNVTVFLWTLSTNQHTLSHTYTLSHTHRHSFILEMAMQMVQKLWRICLQVVPAHLKEILNNVVWRRRFIKPLSIVYVYTRLCQHIHIKLWKNTGAFHYVHVLHDEALEFTVHFKKWWSSSVFLSRFPAQISKRS